jgi:ABC-2 type transport system ATP-binding protein
MQQHLECVEASSAAGALAHGESILELRELSKRYGDHTALDSLTLNVRSGEIVCLLGANGAGKTTTIYSLLGFIRPTSGAALVCGKPAHVEPLAARRAIAFIPEVVVLYEQLSAVENLAFLCAVAGKTHSTAQLEAHLLDAGLDGSALHRRVDTFSKGMRQKVGIALALTRGTKALILDEPLSGLDPKAANEFGEALRTRAANGASVLMATHDLYRAKEIATRIGILRAGRLVDLFDAADLTAHGLEEIYLHHMQK